MATTLLYLIAPEAIPGLIAESGRTRPDPPSDPRAYELHAGLEAGYRVQAMTTLASGDVLFAVEMSGDRRAE